MTKALIIFSTRAGDTRVIADLIAEGMRFSAIEVNVINVKKVKKKSDLAGYDIYVFGSPTYHGDMMENMKTFLFLAEKANLRDKIGGSFGAFGWSGEAPGRIYQTMKNIFKMNMVSGPLMLKSSSIGGGLGMAHDYGKELSAKIIN